MNQSLSVFETMNWCQQSILSPTGTVGIVPAESAVYEEEGIGDILLFSDQ